jgi:hypothetical protein
MAGRFVRVAIESKLQKVRIHPAKRWTRSAYAPIFADQEITKARNPYRGINLDT